MNEIDKEANYRAMLYATALAAESSEDSRWDAVTRIADQDVLTRIAKTDKSHYVRAAAVDRIADHGVIDQIAKTDSSGYVRWAAVRHITNQAVLEQIAMSDKSDDVRAAAFTSLGIISKKMKEGNDGYRNKEHDRRSI